MAEGRQRDEWIRTAAVMHLIHNTSVSKRTDTVSPRHYDPFADDSERRRQAGRTPITRSNLVNTLGAALIGKS